ncbi:DEHA2F15774p [Debaryomyces hansenii CBS767]|uniref:DEHA2F15774p n=1 Tax=Debaryomyces hansenii (strain ATCC 36239 / CBS 767 / BCRC 21394 / JCM 1990 / NBRC 0083 / IGC 2968) TaxID=284592 RepID=Q6BL76_DEBHA|nr:DEHA2F15774p [Debaryomyces hansenii CBS767]CAG89419.2 DEHA2F15774p [Debaryomyces hansenii CBS767]|eukprot:XP_461045.2 DEHA2F15774p [Debaryomyces hansenii CBS767]
MINRSLRVFARRIGPLSKSAVAYRAISCNRVAIPSQVNSMRFSSSDSKNGNSNTASIKVDDPQLMIAFTCKKCDTRSSHTFSKQSYQKGTVLIQCPGCKNRHLIADNLKIFKDNKFSLEEVLKAKGESVATGTEDLAFNDIPESLRETIGHHAKDAPEEYKKKILGTSEGDNPEIPSISDKKV